MQAPPILSSRGISNSTSVQQQQSPPLLITGKGDGAGGSHQSNAHQQSSPLQLTASPFGGALQPATSSMGIDPDPTQSSCTLASWPCEFQQQHSNFLMKKGGTEAKRGEVKNLPVVNRCYGELVLRLKRVRRGKGTITSPMPASNQSHLRLFFQSLDGAKEKVLFATKIGDIASVYDAALLPAELSEDDNVSLNPLTRKTEVELSDPSMTSPLRNFTELPAHSHWRENSTQTLAVIIRQDVPETVETDQDRRVEDPRNSANTNDDQKKKNNVTMRCYYFTNFEDFRSVLRTLSQLVESCNNAAREEEEKLEIAFDQKRIEERSPSLEANNLSVLSTIYSSLSPQRQELKEEHRMDTTATTRQHYHSLLYLQHVDVEMAQKQKQSSRHHDDNVTSEDESKKMKMGSEDEVPKRLFSSSLQDRQSNKEEGDHKIVEYPPAVSAVSITTADAEEGKKTNPEPNATEEGGAENTISFLDPAVVVDPSLLEGEIVAHPDVEREAMMLKQLLTELPPPSSATHQEQELQKKESDDEEEIQCDAFVLTNWNISQHSFEQQMKQGRYSSNSRNVSPARGGEGEIAQQYNPHRQQQAGDGQWVPSRYCHCFIMPAMEPKAQQQNGEDDKIEEQTSSETREKKMICPYKKRAEFFVKRAFESAAVRQMYTSVAGQQLLELRPHGSSPAFFMSPDGCSNRVQKMNPSSSAGYQCTFYISPQFLSSLSSNKKNMFSRTHQQDVKDNLDDNGGLENQKVLPGNQTHHSSSLSRRRCYSAQKEEQGEVTVEYILITSSAYQVDCCWCCCDNTTMSYSASFAEKVGVNSPQDHSCSNSAPSHISSTNDEGLTSSSTEINFDHLPLQRFCHGGTGPQKSSPGGVEKVKMMTDTGRRYELRRHCLGWPVLMNDDHPKRQLNGKGNSGSSYRLVCSTDVPELIVSEILIGLCTTH